MPVPDAFLAAGVCTDLLDRQIYLDQASGVLVRDISLHFSFFR
jgi:hypothetical protein